MLLIFEFVIGAKREVRGLVPILQKIFRFPLQCCNALVRHGLTLLFQEDPSPSRLPVRNCVRSRQKCSYPLEPWPIDRDAALHGEGNRGYPAIHGRWIGDSSDFDSRQRL